MFKGYVPTAGVVILDRGLLFLKMEKNHTRTHTRKASIIL
jgi:hypothetical protein